MTQENMPPSVGEQKKPEKMDSQQEQNMGMLMHLSVFSGCIIPLGSIIVPLILYFLKKDESEYVKHHAIEVLNFQISMCIYGLAPIPFFLILMSMGIYSSVPISFLLILIGFFMLFALLVFNVVMTIIGAIHAHQGKMFRYPLTIRFIR